MLITDLPFPVAIVAPDGWAEFFNSAESAQMWNSVAIRKYSRIGFTVADASGSIWDLIQLTPRKKPSFFDRFRLQPRSTLTDVHLEGILDRPFEVFCERLRIALSTDSDCMTQFTSKEKILSAIDGAKSVLELSQQLRKMRAI